jgi:predicted secreted hydrolase
MAFRIRGREGATLWATAKWRSPGKPARGFASGDVAFDVRRRWTSPRTGVSYPVELSVRVEDREWHVLPLMDDQELDARASTGTLYWEGAVSLRASPGPGGRGYLELTGYDGKLPF